ncbi:MAG: phospholipid carrier-dependent glycosyltransferase [Clostridiales bacterium]|jgi:Gpi18-like mannosyltransferase/predicted membrane-bound dolichyl-phosphate-mannose-protein mannosyltransferase|nr:phospholipid carrier-dependent glycosyltransferase [Clostridiales bacterium]
MSIIYSLSALTVFAVAVLCIADIDLRRIKGNPLAILLAVGFIVRIAFINTSYGYETDINTFKAWASMLWEGGLGSFYSSGQFTDYPPGYMYVLYVLGGLNSALSLEGEAFGILLKLPAIICDLLAIVLLYHLASTKWKRSFAILIGLAYALNPASILDSSVWGQVDSVHTLLLAVAVWCLAERRYARAYLSYAFAILVKPQSFILAPVFIYSFFDAVFIQTKSNPVYDDFVHETPEDARKAAIESRKRMRLNRIYEALRLFSYALYALLLMLLLMLPFTEDLDISPIIELYVETLAQYPYASVNAYNLYAFLGGNWRPITDSFMGMNYNSWGFAFLSLTVIFSLISLYRGRGRRSSLYFVSGLLFALTFLLSVKMHERYLFPAMIFFLLAYIHKPDKRLLIFYAGYTALAFVNCADILNMLKNGNKLEYIEKSMPFASLLNICLTGALAVCAVLMYKAQSIPDLDELEEEEFEEVPAAIEKSKPPLRLSIKDALFIIALAGIYSAVAFWNLGDWAAPQTAWAPQNGQSAVLKLNCISPERTPETFSYLLGARHDKSFTLSVSEDGQEWREISQYKGESVFLWVKLACQFSERYVKITSLDDDLMIQELAFRDKYGDLVPINATSSGNGESEDPLINDYPSFLCDEQQLVPEEPTYMNSTYFDEIYHARTAYEFVHGLSVYEWTHPPLGKDMIALCIKIFGMTPFGWRFAGTFTGVLMLPVIYIFSKKIFIKSHWAMFSTTLLSVDFMHFAQTRIATIDVFVTFFIMLMYLFMLLYYNQNFFEIGKKRHSTFVRSLLYLALCGIFMGLAVAAKWEGIYAMAGLPVIFFYYLNKRRKEYCLRAEIEEGEKKSNAASFPTYLKITIPLCFVFFIAIPIAIYCVSYIPFLYAQGDVGIKGILDNQADMFRYHSKLVSEHAFSSYWFTWPFMTRPIYYYSGTAANGLKTGISSFGNPAIWWMGIAAVFYCIRAQSKRYDGAILFLFTAYASNYLPWALVSRTTYIYHYFPSVPFIILLITYMFKNGINPKHPKAAVAYVILAALLFIAFYPVISGFPIPMAFVDAALKWFPTWVLS